jgi:hypothetical protein
VSNIGDTKVVDLISSRPDSRVVRLIIIDPLSWSDLERHSRLLQEKINSYLAFVQSKQLYQIRNRRIPESAEVHIVLRALHAPPPAAHEFLGRVKAFLQGKRMVFKIEVERKA